MSWEECQRRVNALRRVRRSNHFVVHYNLRNPRRNLGSGAAGVRSPALISCYIDGLERLHRAMTSAPFNRRHGDEGRPVPVYVFETSDLNEYRGEPFTSTDELDRPFIALPCRSAQPTLHGEHQYASTCAVHEATHVFNHWVRPMQDSASWRWFDEAVAVFMESWVYAGNPDHLRFGMNWSDAPEAPLDHPRHHYSANIFAWYLAKYFGPEILSEVWKNPNRKFSALDAIAECLREKEVLLSSDDPEKKVLFATYCADSYFLADSNSRGFLPELHARYGGRAITESFRIGSGSPVEPAEFSVDRLSCRYFLFDPSDDVAKVTASVTTPAANGRTFLRACLCEVREDMTQGECWPLEPQEGPEGEVTFGIRPVAINREDLDHLVLVVSNCGYRAADPPIRRVDGIKFRIRACAV
jgi:hypothetical protein